MYSQFEEMLKAGDLEEIKIRNLYIEGKLKAPEPNRYKTIITARVDPQFA